MLAKLVLTVLALTGGNAQVVQIHGRGAWPYEGPPGNSKEFVIRTVAELTALCPHMEQVQSPAEEETRVMADVTKALGVKDIDWKTQMLVIVKLDHVHPDHPATVTGLKVHGKVMTVHYQYWQPVAARPQDSPPKPVSVSLMALVDRFDGEVHFKGNANYPK